MTDIPRILLLPGWQDSDACHWQSRWKQLYGFERVEQADWLWPRRGDWMARLEDVLLADARPAFLVAHSLGCHLVGAWAAHTQHAARVLGALLVAPPDVSRSDIPPQLSSWRVAPAGQLPFPSLLLYSEDDPSCTPDVSRRLAQAWQARAVSLGAAGHVNGASGLGDWPEGLHWLQQVLPPAPA